MIDFDRIPWSVVYMALRDWLRHPDSIYYLVLGVVVVGLAVVVRWLFRQGA